MPLKGMKLFYSEDQNFVYTTTYYGFIIPLQFFEWISNSYD